MIAYMLSTVNSNRVIVRCWPTLIHGDRTKSDGEPDVIGWRGGGDRTLLRCLNPNSWWTVRFLEIRSILLDITRFFIDNM